MLHCLSAGRVALLLVGSILQNKTQLQDFMGKGVGVQASKRETQACLVEHGGSCPCKGHVLPRHPGEDGLGGQCSLPLRAELS